MPVRVQPWQSDLGQRAEVLIPSVGSEQSLCLRRLLFTPRLTHIHQVSIPPTVMLSQLLDNDVEWVNIPSVVRSALRVMAKESALSKIVVDDLRRELQESRDAIAEWASYTRLLEVDSRDHLSKLDGELGSFAADSTTQLTSVSRQVAALRDDLHRLSQRIDIGDRRCLAHHAELGDLMQAQATELRTESDRQHKALLQRAMEHCDSHRESEEQMRSALQSELTQLMSRAQRETDERLSDYQAAHRRALTATTAVREELSREIVAMSNRLSELARENQSSTSRLDEIRVALKPLTIPEFTGLPHVVEHLALSVERKYEQAQAVHTALATRVEEEVSRLLATVRETSERLLTKVEHNRIDVYGKIEECNASVGRSRTDNSVVFERCCAQLDSIVSFVGGDAVLASSSLSTVCSGIVHSVTSTMAEEYQAADAKVRSEMTDAIARAERGATRACEELGDSLRAAWNGSCGALRASFDGLRRDVADASRGVERSCELLEERVSAHEKSLQHLSNHMDAVESEMRNTTAAIRTAAHDADALCTKRSHEQTDALSLAMVRVQSSFDIKIADVQQSVADLSVKEGRLADEIRAQQLSAASSSTALASLADRLERAEAALENTVVSTQQVALQARDELQRSHDSTVLAITALSQEVRAMEDLHRGVAKQATECTLDALTEAREARRVSSDVEHELQLAAARMEERLVKVATSCAVQSDEALRHLEESLRRLEHHQTQTDCDVAAVREALLEKNTEHQRTGNSLQYFSPFGSARRPSATRDASGEHGPASALEHLQSRLCALEALSKRPMDVQTDCDAYTKTELDERFENHWNSVLLLLARKEDSAELTAKLQRLRDELLQEMQRVLDGRAQ